MPGGAKVFFSCHHTAITLEFSKLKLWSVWSLGLMWPRSWCHPTHDKSYSNTHENQQLFKNFFHYNYCFSSLKVSLCAHMWSPASLPETYHSRRTWVRGRSSRAGAAGTCQAWCGEAPPRCCSPYPQPATLQWDSSPARRSVTRKQHIPMSNCHQLYLNLKNKACFTTSNHLNHSECVKSSFLPVR